MSWDIIYMYILIISELYFFHFSMQNPGFWFILHLIQWVLGGLNDVMPCLINGGKIIILGNHNLVQQIGV